MLLAHWLAKIKQSKNYYFKLENLEGQCITA